MSGYHDLLPLARIAEILGGDARRFDVVAPGPGHSAADRSMSVRPDEGAPDGFLVHSFAGDDAIECKEYVTEKLGLTPKSKSGGTGGGRARKPIAEYIYYGEDGTPYLRVQKFRDADGKKQYPQSHWEGKGWASGKPAGPKIPYRLPELIKATPDTPIYFCEGEKSVDRLAQLGFVATCVSEGAQASLPSDVAKWFKDRKRRGHALDACPGCHGCHGSSRDIRDTNRDIGRRGREWSTV
jgi:hypothetical protein